MFESLPYEIDNCSSASMSLRALKTKYDFCSIFSKWGNIPTLGDGEWFNRSKIGDKINSIFGSLLTSCSCRQMCLDDTVLKAHKNSSNETASVPAYGDPSPFENCW